MKPKKTIKDKSDNMTEKEAEDYLENEDRDRQKERYLDWNELD